MSNEDTANARLSLLDLLEVTAAELPAAARYFVTGIIGEGGMGKVYLGYDDTLGREVAIKVMLDEADESHAERFYREAKIMAALNHSNIIRIMDYSGPKSPRQFLVMERLSGHTVEHFIERAAWPESVAAALGFELAQAFVHAHSVGVLHRDVKPENVFVEPNGRVVLLDFGLAKGLLTDGDRDTFKMSATKLMGTPLFGSPEQCSGKYELTARSDIFSLGAVLYYALSQVYPFRGESLMEVIDAVVQTPHQPITDLVDVSPAFAAVIDRCLQKHPEDRYQTAEEVMKDLQRVLQAQRVSGTSQALAAFYAGVPLAEREVSGIGSVVEERTSIARRTPAERLDKTQIATRAKIGQRQHTTAVTQLPGRAPKAVSAKPTALKPAGMKAAPVTTTTRKPAGLITEPALGEQKKKSKLPMIVAALFLMALGVGAGSFIARSRRTQAQPSGPTVASAVSSASVPTLVPTPSMPTQAAAAATGPSIGGLTASPLPTPAEAPKSDAKVLVRIIVKPWGKVSIDGTPMGVTPSFRETQLTLGSHVVEVAHPTLGSRSKPFVVIPPETELVIDLVDNK